MGSMGNALQFLFDLAVVLGIVIFVHELGHFLMAKWRGVTVLRFSMGMGPEMVGFTAGGTRYAIAWVPLGGFVQMAGDAPSDDGHLPEGGQEQFLTHHWFGRILIALAGPGANLITAWVVLVLVMTTGFQQPDAVNLLGPIDASSAAATLGMREGDRIVEFDAKPVATWHDLELAAASRDTTHGTTFVMERDQQRFTISVPRDQVGGALRSLEPPRVPAIVGMVRSGLPAYRSGVREGDRILAVAGVRVSSFDQIGGQLRPRTDTDVPLTIERDGKVITINVRPLSQSGGGGHQDGIIGIEPPRGLTWTQRISFGRAVKEAFPATWGLVQQVYAGMWLSISRPVYYREYVGGPIFIGQMARDAARHGLDELLNFLAMINIAIMAFNLLPVPLLDGGHILLALLEAIRRRALTARAYLNFQKVGLVLVGTLFVFIISKDIVRPFQRMRALEHAPRETTTVAP